MEISKNLKISAFFDRMLLIRSHPYVGFPGGSDGKESACNAGDSGSVPGSGRSHREGNSNPL